MSPPPARLDRKEHRPDIGGQKARGGKTPERRQPVRQDLPLPPCRARLPGLLVGPLLGRRAERVRLPAPAPAPLAHRVAAYLELRAGLGDELAGTLRPHLVRKTPVPTQGPHLLDPLPITRAHGAVLQPPGLAAGGHDFNVQTSAVEALIGGFGSGSSTRVERSGRCSAIMARRLPAGAGSCRADPAHRHEALPTPPIRSSQLRISPRVQGVAPWCNVHKRLFLFAFAASRDARKP